MGNFVTDQKLREKKFTVFMQLQIHKIEQKQ